ncbi:acyltransferase domain-containing protein [Ditylenchus destructor]|uniref:Acyltransferase domain-containing protein n=1 Tax=Ditylenchus destructor TaxID=166010 RepID=A0AAD4ND99_9BILA|nr:acyltransferase domain-containing protein [Ditylenchus destructor]
MSSSPSNSQSGDEEAKDDGRKKSREKPPGSRSKWTVSNTAERILWIFLTPIRALICVSNVTVFFITYFGLMLPVLWAKPLWPRFYWYYEGKLYVWLQAFIAYWGYTADYDVYEYGDDITELCEKERILLICNHQSTADVPTLFSLLQSKGVATRKTLWLMDVMFRWTPFGIIGNMHGDYFIQQGKATRDKELIRLKEHLQKVFWNRDRRLVILFPEGGFYYKRVESSQRYARENGYPHLKWSTLPRLGAVRTILEEVGPRKEESEEQIQKSRSISKLLKDTVGAIREKKYVKDTRPPIKYILDVTIAYPNGQPLSLATMIFGAREKCDIAVNYKIYDATEVPFEDEESLRKWMFHVYEEKDKILDNYYKTGAFHSGENGNRIVFKWSRIIGMYAFWITAAVVQFKLYPWLIHKAFSFLVTLTAEELEEVSKIFREEVSKIVREALVESNQNQNYLPIHSLYPITGVLTGWSMGLLISSYLFTNGVRRIIDIQVAALVGAVASIALTVVYSYFATRR